jgi:hypothetical protein
MKTHLNLGSGGCRGSARNDISGPLWRMFEKLSVTIAGGAENDDS